MARWTQRSYWRVVNGVRAEFDLSLAEARAAYRFLKERLGRSVFGTDLDRHPRIVREEVRNARLDLVREDVGVEPPPRRAGIGDVVYEEPEYEEFELTATTKGHTPRAD